MDIIILLMIVCLASSRIEASKVIFGYEDEAKNLVKNWDFNSNPSANDWVADGVKVAKVPGGYQGGTCFKIYYSNVIFGYEDEAKNLVSNWDFDSKPSDNDWVADKVQVKMISGGYQGGTCFKIYSRTKTSSCVKQRVTSGLRTNTNYYVSLFLKQLNDDSVKDYTRFRLYVRMRLQDGSTITKEVGRLPFQRKDNVWKQLGGNFKTPSGALSYIEISLNVDPVSINYLIDKASMIVLEKQADWKAYLNSKIDANRRSDVQIRATFPKNHNLAKTKIKIKLIRHKFGFGTAIKALLFTRNSAVNINYRNFVLDTFNWAVFENDQKWRQMEPTEGANKTGKVDQSLDILEKHNFTVRGHTVHWDIKATNPAWVQPKTGSDMINEVNARITKLITHYRGRIHEYDICNEYLHEHYIEDVTHIFNMIGKEFKRVHKLDPAALLFLNDYEILRNGMLTSAQADLARSLKAQGYPVHGIGIESHLRTLPIEMEVFEKRIQISSAVGLPVSITELSFHDSNEQVKADAADMAYRVFFSEPGVTDCILWGFSDQPGFSFINDMYLTTGVGMKPNKAGKVLVDLITKEWNTTKEFKPDVTSFRKSFRAIHGTYQVTIETNGQVVTEGQYYVDKDVTNVMKISV